MPPIDSAASRNNTVASSGRPSASGGSASNGSSAQRAESYDADQMLIRGMEFIRIAYDRRVSELNAALSHERQINHQQAQQIHTLERERDRVESKLDDTESALSESQSELRKLGQAYEELRNSHARIRAWATQLEEFRKSIVNMVQYGMGAGQQVNPVELERSFQEVTAHAPLRQVVDAAAGISESMFASAGIRMPRSHRGSSMSRDESPATQNHIDEESIPDNFANATTAMFNTTVIRTPTRPASESLVITSTPKRRSQQPSKDAASKVPNSGMIPTPPSDERPQPAMHKTSASTAKRFGMRDVPTMVQSSPIRPKTTATNNGTSSASKSIRPGSANGHHSQPRMPTSARSSDRGMVPRYSASSASGGNSGSDDDETEARLAEAENLYSEIRRILPKAAFREFAGVIQQFNAGQMSASDAIFMIEPMLQDKILFLGMKRMMRSAERAEREELEQTMNQHQSDLMHEGAFNRNGNPQLSTLAEESREY